MDDMVVQLLVCEIEVLRKVGERMKDALENPSEKSRVLALALWEQTKRGDVE